MIAVTISGAPAWLLPYMPESTARLGARLPVDAQRGLTGRSSRRPQAVGLRYSLEWSASLRRSEFAALRNATQIAQNEPVVVPVWPFAIRVGKDTQLITSGLTVAWTEDWATVAINPGSLVGYDYAAPLLYGYLVSAPSMGAANDELVTADFSVTEDAPVGYSFAPNAGLLAADTTFNTAGGFAAPIFPFLPDWGDMPRPGVALVDVERQEVGQGRLQSTSFFPQTPELVQQATFKFTTALGGAKLLAWWARRAGISEPHWVATTQTIGRLSAAAPAGTAVLNFKHAIAPGPNSYVALFSPDDVLEIGRIGSSASQQITLAANLANTWGPSLTCVNHAILARHTNDELAITFERAGDGWMASCTLNWREVAPEYAPPGDETRGTTIGRLPGAAWFFQIDLDYNGALRTWYLTNWESGAYANLINWVYNACTFNRLIQDVDLEDDSLTVSFRWFAGGPWENWQPGMLAARGYITIFQADVDAAGAFSNFRQSWKGELKTPQLEGPFIKQKAVGANATFARMAPRQVMSSTCGTMLFKSRCGLLLSDWTFNAVVTAVAGNVVTLGTITRANGGGLPGGFGAADWFALGWMGWSSGGNPLRDGILTSSALGGGTLSVTLERASTLGVGSNVTLVPGCDRQGATCRTKFANYANFRGFEFMPSVSPSFVIPQRNVSSAKK